jgi:hypothetical protein
MKNSLGGIWVLFAWTSFGQVHGEPCSLRLRSGQALFGVRLFVDAFIRWVEDGLKWFRVV